MQPAQKKAYQLCLYCHGGLENVLRSWALIHDVKKCLVLKVRLLVGYHHTAACRGASINFCQHVHEKVVAMPFKFTGKEDASQMPRYDRRVIVARLGCS